VTDIPPCPLCNRGMIAGPSVTKHHLIPKLKGGKKADPCHAVCHNKIHATWDENQLRDSYNTWEALRTAPEMQTFLRWVRNKPLKFTDPSKMRNGHRRRGRR
jgi:hypothetical protein